MEIVKKLSHRELEQSLEKGGILCRAICEILGKPKEHVEETVRALVQKAREVQDTELLEYDIPDVVPQEKLFSTFAEMEILFKKKEALMGFCFDFMPSSIEIIEPENIVLDNELFSSWLNELQGRLHKVDMVAKERTLLSNIYDTNLTKIVQYNILSHLRNASLNSQDLQRMVGVDEESLIHFLNPLIERGEVIHDGELFTIAPHVKFDYESQK